MTALHRLCFFVSYFWLKAKIVSSSLCRKLKQFPEREHQVGIQLMINSKILSLLLQEWQTIEILFIVLVWYSCQCDLVTHVFRDHLKFTWKFPGASESLEYAQSHVFLQWRSIKQNGLRIQTSGVWKAAGILPSPPLARCLKQAARTFEPVST